jgi:hypothetical protein
MTLLVVGSIAYDSIETPTGSVKDALGGSAIHFSAASSLYVQTRIVGVVGEEFTMEDLSFLSERNADTSGIVSENGKTFRWSGRYHENMNNRDSLSTELNVFEHFQPNIPEYFKDSKHISCKHSSKTSIGSTRTCNKSCICCSRHDELLDRWKQAGT